MREQVDRIVTLVDPDADGTTTHVISIEIFAVTSASVRIGYAPTKLTIVEAIPWVRRI